MNLPKVLFILPFWMRSSTRQSFKVQKDSKELFPLLSHPPFPICGFLRDCGVRRDIAFGSHLTSVKIILSSSSMWLVTTVHPCVPSLVSSLGVTEISNVSVSEDSGLGSELLHKIARKPQLSSLAAIDLQRLCITDRVVFDELADITARGKMESTMRAVLRRTFEEIRDADFSGVPDHIKRLIETLKRQYGVENRGLVEMSDVEIEQNIIEYEVANPEHRLICAVTWAFASIVVGHTDPLELFFGTRAAESLYSNMFSRHNEIGQLGKFLDLLSHETPSLRILEVGAGAGSASSLFLAILQGFEHETGQTRFREFIYTDISPSFFEDAQEKSKTFRDRMYFKTLDIEIDPQEQGFEPETFDLVIAGNAIHTCKDISTTLTRVRKLLKPHGFLALLERTNPESLSLNFVFGVLKGWWNACEDWRQNSALVTEEGWYGVLQQSGFSECQATLYDA
ncbi:putative polyketide synthase [Rosellinia necatrix]|uniref:Putative polyketide synthase n=1 Tax=Rosellinia necatrix TaxID=77044 RepID=A0A1S8A9U1_ROSNE|nr:putative polyketide synthase [Rosellinia necatrix]